MKTKTSIAISGVIMALPLISGTATFAESQGTENTMAEVQAFLTSPTSLSQAIATAEAAATGKVSSIEYQNGENGGPNLILAEVVLKDGTGKTVAINPADGKVMNVQMTADDQRIDEADDDGEPKDENVDN